MASFEELRNVLMSPQGEGTLSYMYRDSKGKVTVGVGTLLNNSSEAKTLRFVYRDDPTKDASKEDIEKEFITVHATPYLAESGKAFAATHYQDYTKLILPDSEIIRLLDERSGEKKKQLRHYYKDYTTYPIAVQVALLDMAYNLGASGLRHKQPFKEFNKAIDHRNFEKAAETSNRADVSTERNNSVKRWLKEAANQEKVHPYVPPAPPPPPPTSPQQVHKIHHHHQEGAKPVTGKLIVKSRSH